MEEELESYCTANNWFEDQLPRAKILEMVKRWILESHERARDIYDVGFLLFWMIINDDYQ